MSKTLTIKDSKVEEFQVRLTIGFTIERSFATAAPNNCGAVSRPRRLLLFELQCSPSPSRCRGMVMRAYRSGRRYSVPCGTFCHCFPRRWQS
jgi:hypothetical protein